MAIESDGATCVRCGRSALGRATDGLQYCERISCIDWKLERIKAQIERESRRVLVAATIV